MTVSRQIQKILERKDVFIGEGVILEGDVEIGHNVEIWHRCIIGFSAECKRSKLRIVEVKKGGPDVVTLGSRTKVHPYVIIHKGTKIGSDVCISEYSTIGQGTTIGDGTVIEYGAKIYDRVRIGRESIVAGFCCNDSKIGNCTTMMGHLVHEYPKRMCAKEWNETDERPRAPQIEDNVVIGYNAIIIGDVTVGRGSYIGAGAIITKNVPRDTKKIMKIDFRSSSISREI